MTTAPATARRCQGRMPNAILVALTRGRSCCRCRMTHGAGRAGLTQNAPEQQAVPILACRGAALREPGAPTFCAQPQSRFRRPARYSLSVISASKARSPSPVAGEYRELASLVATSAMPT